MLEKQSKFPIRNFQIPGCIPFAELAKTNNFNFKYSNIKVKTCITNSNDIFYKIFMVDYFI